MYSKESIQAMIEKEYLQKQRILELEYRIELLEKENNELKEKIVLLVSEDKKVF